MARVESLTRSETWQEIRARHDRFIIFKHSSTCPISAAGRDRFVAWVDGLAEDRPPIYQVLVIEDRPLSQEIAADLGVDHQSPQAILVDGGKALWHASHWAITAESLDAAMADPGVAASHSTSLAQAQAEHKAAVGALESR